MVPGRTTLSGWLHKRQRQRCLLRSRPSLRMMETPSFKSGKPFCTVNNAPFTLMLNSLSKCSSETLGSGTNSPTPALAKIMSIRPFTLLTVWYRRSRSGLVLRRHPGRLLRCCRSPSQPCGLKWTKSLESSLFFSGLATVDWRSLSAGPICGFRRQRLAFLGENLSVSKVGSVICENVRVVSAPPYPAERKSKRVANHANPEQPIPLCQHRPLALPPKCGQLQPQG